MTDQFLLCRACGQLSPVGPQLAGPWHEDEGPSDINRFRRAHGSHGLEVATRTAAPAVFDRPIWDPMGTVWFEVQAGSEKFVVCSVRPSIGESRGWAMTPGAIEGRASEVALDEAYLRLALDRWFHPQVLPPRVSDRVLAVVGAVAQTLDPVALTTAYDDADDPQVSIAPLPIDARARVLSRTQSFLGDIERHRFKEFVDSHSGADGALALRVRHPFVVRRR